ALAQSDDPELAGRASRSLGALEPRLAAAFLAGEADEEVLAYFAAEQGHPLLLEAIMRRRDVPPALLVNLAPPLSAALQELLLLRQDAIVEEPAILDALARNPQLSPYSQRRIGEYREHLLPRERPVPAPATVPLEEEEEMDEAAFAAAVAAVRSAPG